MNSDPSTNGSPRVLEKTENGRSVPSITIVTSIYRSEATIGAFVERALAAVSPFAANVNVVVVDDGSPDRSAEIVRDIVDRDPRVTLVQLSRNFGHHRALIAGLERAKGDLVFLIDSDLEEEPEHFGDMFSLMRDAGADAVYGVQKHRKGNMLERVAGKLFYDIFSALSEIKLPRNVSTMRVMSARYVRSLLLFRDHNPVLVPLTLITGYRQEPFSFVKKSHSETTYSLSRRFSLLLLAVTSFTARPLALMFWLSLFLSAGGFLVGIAVVVLAMLGPVQDGWSSLMAAIIFFFSLNALFTGVLGLYVKLILDEVKDRPRTIVQEIYGKVPEMPGGSDGRS
jgi:putative glycosyltransferase